MPSCNPDRQAVTLDVDAGEYLEYTVTFAPGQTANYAVRDTTKRKTILGPPHREAQWPKPGQSVDRGRHQHVFGADFVSATKYTYKVVVCHPSGATKRVIKTCSWTHPGRRPKSGFRVTVK